MPNNRITPPPSPSASFTSQASTDSDWHDWHVWRRENPLASGTNTPTTISRRNSESYDHVTTEVISFLRAAPRPHYEARPPSPTGLAQGHPVPPMVPTAHGIPVPAHGTPVWDRPVAHEMPRNPADLHQALEEVAFANSAKLAANVFEYFLNPAATIVMSPAQVAAHDEGVFSQWRARPLSPKKQERAASLMRLFERSPAAASVVRSRLGTLAAIKRSLLAMYDPARANRYGVYVGLGIPGFTNADIAQLPWRYQFIAVTGIAPESAGVVER